VTAPGARPLICLAAVALIVSALIVSAGCGPKRVASPTPGRTQVVLLDDPDSPASSVNVTSKAGSVALTTPLESTSVVASRPPTAPVKLDEADVQRQFATLLADLPAAVQHFNLYFRTETSDLTEESRAILPDVLSAVATRKIPEVTVIGHTDTTGSAANNYRLGLDRAQMVKTLLVRAGLDASLIEVESHGEADLLRKTADNTPEPRNRRVEITIR
jgi:outer membrane protein OmpA-like peptidoglycan-associated protein